MDIKENGSQRGLTQDVLTKPCVRKRVVQFFSSISKYQWTVAVGVCVFIMSLLFRIAAADQKWGMEYGFVRDNYFFFHTIWPVIPLGSLVVIIWGLWKWRPRAENVVWCALGLMSFCTGLMFIGYEQIRYIVYDIFMFRWFWVIGFGLMLGTVGVIFYGIRTTTNKIKVMIRSILLGLNSSITLIFAVYAWIAVEPLRKGLMEIGAFLPWSWQTPSRAFEVWFLTLTQWTRWENFGARTPHSHLWWGEEYWSGIQMLSIANAALSAVVILGLIYIWRKNVKSSIV